MDKAAYTLQVSERAASDFRERARVEADRYGPDPWIFVRELLQNARDAGASRVVIAVDEDGTRTRISCRDDGEGMGYAHAKRYLFSLYASSKESRANQVGRFGVGFWSILRFEPERITIRSRPRDPGHGGGWQIQLSGDLRHAVHTELPDGAMEPGTEIHLERAATDGADARRVREAAVQNARFLGMRDEPDTPLPVVVNGRAINLEFGLPAPSSSFRRGRVRGVVGLGSAPRVELFSRGLRVRSAACLDDLLTASGHTDHSRVRFPELPGGLAPQALLESDGLELLLSRSDARDNRTLRRLVKLGQQELRHLVEHQLAQVRPPGIGERIAGAFRRLAGESTWWRAVLGAMCGALLAVVVARLIWPNPGARAGVSSQATTQASDRTRYGDLSKRYNGPQVSVLDASAAEPVALAYTPPSARPYFAALIIDRVGGRSVLAPDELDTPYPAFTCRDACLTIELPVAEDAGEALRIPVPSGHRLEVESVSYVGLNQSAFPTQVWLSDAGEAVLALDGDAPGGVAGVLRYRTGPGSALAIPARARERLPAELQAEAEALHGLERDERVSAAIDLVRERVAYQTSSSVAAQHDRASKAGTDFVTRTLEIGAGDCDVQNGLLVAVLHAADVDARLAVGWVGHAGGVSAWLHAWVEYLGEDGRWRVADATARGSASGERVAGLPAPADDVAVGGRVELPELPESGDAPTSEQPLIGETGEVGEEVGEVGERPDGRSVDDAASDAPTEDADGDRSLVERLPPSLRALTREPWVPWAALGSGLLGLLLLVGSLRRRTARRVHLDEGGDLSSLLQGALAQPAAFRHLPSLFHRRLIPLRGGAAISLNRARTLAADGRLYVGRERTQLCRRARARGVTLLDAETPEGRTVAASLAAIDLDRWGGRLDRARELPTLSQIAAHVRDHGESWRLLVLQDHGGRITSLDLRPLLGAWAGRASGDRLVLIDAGDPWLEEAEALRERAPNTACFALLDHILDHLDYAPERRARLLAPLAALALAEAAKRGEA